MHANNRVFTVMIALAVTSSLADETLYRYEGDVLLSELPDEWPDSNPCDQECTAFIEDGHFVLFWATTGDEASFWHWIAAPGEPPPPAPFWVEWRFRSNHPLGQFFWTCDGQFTVRYDGTLDTAYMYGDAAISEGGGLVSGLDIAEFHLYRFQSLDGISSRTAVDGRVFMVEADNNASGSSFLLLRGKTGCGVDSINNQKHEWDFVRYGTIDFGERIIAADPPGGYLDPAIYSNLDRFTVTFDSANYVYINDITVETTGGIVPQVIQTRRRETDDVDTVEIVLDRALPAGELTRFIFNDGQTTNIIEYSFNPITTGACCTSDGACIDVTSGSCAAATGSTYLGDGTPCAGTDTNSDGHDDACDHLFPIPTLSDWGLIAMTLLVLTAGTLVLALQHRSAT